MSKSCGAFELSIYHDELMKCGCTLRKYTGGRCVIKHKPGCLEHLVDVCNFVCGVCNKPMLKKELKIHRGTHGY